MKSLKRSKFQKKKIKKPSERYPKIPIRDVPVDMKPLPQCTSCGKEMMDSGMTEESEQLNVIPKKYEIIRTLRKKYRCSCHSCIITAPVEPRIIPNSSYSDDMILDVALSKYCDLIPIERYSTMAARNGLKDLPPHSLIDLTHGLAKYLRQAYELLRIEIMKSRVLHADETPHYMLEGSKTKFWYLWGFSTPTTCYLECHDTRSGDVASELLKTSQCEILLTDVFSGYGKAVRETNEYRFLKKLKLLKNANCNAHARRYFFKTRINYPQAEYYLEKYQKIYYLHSQSKDKSKEDILKLRE